MKSTASAVMRRRFSRVGRRRLGESEAGMMDRAVEGGSEGFPEAQDEIVRRKNTGTWSTALAAARHAPNEVLPGSEQVLPWSNPRDFGGWYGTSSTERTA
jgi:hypothetical protein